MPDILIRGMEMPIEDDLLCLNIHPNGDVTINLDLKCIPIARAVELPPHGDLIDRDYIQRTLQPYSKEDEQVEVTLGTAKRLIQNAINAPVVVPAERRDADA